MHFQTERAELEQINSVARAIIANDRRYSDGGWSLDGDPEDPDQRISMLLNVENCEGADPETVAKKVRQILLDRALGVDPDLKQELEDAKRAEDVPPARQPLVETSFPEFRSSEMMRLSDKLDLIASVGSLYQDRNDLWLVVARRDLVEDTRRVLSTEL